MHMKYILLYHLENSRQTKGTFLQISLNILRAAGHFPVKVYQIPKLCVILKVRKGLKIHPEEWFVFVKFFDRIHGKIGKMNLANITS